MTMLWIQWTRVKTAWVFRVAPRKTMLRWQHLVRVRVHFTWPWFSAVAGHGGVRRQNKKSKQHNNNNTNKKNKIKNKPGKKTFLATTNNIYNNSNHNNNNDIQVSNTRFLTDDIYRIYLNHTAQWFRRLPYLRIARDPSCMYPLPHWSRLAWSNLSLALSETGQF